MKKRMFLSLSLLVILSACVEIKDPEKEITKTEDGREAKVEVKTAVVHVATQLIVDQPLYLYEGRVLTQSQLESERRWPSPDQPQSYQYDYMEIRKGGVLYTLGQDVKLEIKELLSEGRIETLPEGSVAADLQNGRSGGNLHITIHKALGRGLKVIMRGQRGGKGANGDEPDEKLRGVKGDYVYEHECDNPEALKRWQGKKGLDGYNGKAGMRGGDSGTLILSILDYDQIFPYSYDRLPGIGGQGGDENPRGGKQGFNGGSMCPYLRMPRIKEDPQMAGGPGQRGPPGADGKMGSVQIIDKNQKFFYP